MHISKITTGFFRHPGVKEYNGQESERYQLLLRPDRIQLSNDGLEAIVTKTFHAAGQGIFIAA